MPSRCTPHAAIRERELIQMRDRMRERRESMRLRYEQEMTKLRSEGDEWAVQAGAAMKQLEAWLGQLRMKVAEHPARQERALVRRMEQSRSRWRERPTTRQRRK
eukprot:TRINITY_DN51421_c0_g1_i1.p2 TRINITY_DN51421_c0_g1~~TRINITY_DN51421_c0_g1_i1.p2  ORF type:complete len:104 (-),score=13.20 TRINITY_DN51421_c0_g1_i1:331-642(-)